MTKKKISKINLYVHYNLLKSRSETKPVRGGSMSDKYERMIKNNEMHEKMVKNFDKSLFKGKDLGLLEEVVSFLEEHGLDFEIRGSAEQNALEGRPRNYRDIDIVVHNYIDITGADDGLSDKGRYESIMGLARGYANIDHPGNPSFSEDIRSFSQDGHMYVDTHIDNRATISRDDPRTTIDLCFENQYK